MTTYVLHGDALSSHELRHEIGEPILDTITFVEHDGKRIVFGGFLEEPILTKREDVVDEFVNVDALGAQDLVRDVSFSDTRIDTELLARAIEHVGSRAVVVPPSFPLLAGDYLRDRGIEVSVDEDAWIKRRRRKAPWELEGMERAQRAADVAMLAAARMLRDAEPTADGRLRFEGEILTAEWIGQVMVAELVNQGAECEEIIVHSGDAWTGGHDVGAGPILPQRSCIIDCYPRDRRSGAWSDMTRTFLPGGGSPDLQKLHRHCRDALDIAFEAIKPGRSDAYSSVADHFESLGFPTQRAHAGSGNPDEGFIHSLGHGVGLQVHEKPWMGRRSDVLAEGDVVAVEPGLYFKGVGGVRLEDTVVVTPAGPEHLTEPYSYDLSP